MNFSRGCRAWLAGQVKVTIPGVTAPRFLPPGLEHRRRDAVEVQT